uniref:Uncharacterized protein n=1 Tax=Candidatus Methanogaster sp. ANME-2c ERB4 TaxID=2759911 RepID=A0A7G9YLB1_9EURY|nr:hypothetical protein IMBEDNDK_00005 [Methanosarcinales archaeon ANME-2c ERB4]
MVQERREFRGCCSAIVREKPELGREIALNSYKNGDASLWKASGIDRRLSVCHALLSIFTKTLV